MFMEIEDVKSDNPQKSDLVAEARELLTGISQGERVANGNAVHIGLHCVALAFGDTLAEINANSLLYTHAPEIISSLCAELEQLRSQHSVQAENIAQLHEQEKAMRAAIEAAISWFEYQNGITSNKTTAAWVERTLRAAITPKGEQG